MKARKTALLGILCAQAIALSFLENLIPSLPFPPHLQDAHYKGSAKRRRIFQRKRIIRRKYKLWLLHAGLSEWFGQ